MQTFVEMIWNHPYINVLFLQTRVLRTNDSNVSVSSRRSLLHTFLLICLLSSSCTVTLPEEGLREETETLESFVLNTLVCKNNTLI